MPSATNDAVHALGHVNLMTDTLIAHATLNDLRAIVRDTLSKSPPEVARTFTATARLHLAKTKATALPVPGTLFLHTADGGAPGWEHTPELTAVLERSRVLYGAGMGVSSLAILTEVVRAVIGLRWDADSPMETILSYIDGDLTQAIQSSKEEIAGGLVTDVERARCVRESLLGVLLEVQQEVEGWDGDFPFEWALLTMKTWNI
ncbi:hypothetical protein C2E23DRAFT_879901 [Lenzites betulinus]|nr:hypothetical protein C2E23DRAFT_879901 [Lenzites betulinus]